MSNEMYSKHCMVGTVKHGGGSVMFWGAMSGAGTGTLEPIDYKMCADDYIEILDRNLITSVRKCIENPDGYWFLMQDGDPKHTAKKTMKYLLENGIPLLEWPPQSPDLNPIEHLWKCIKDDIAASGFRAKTKTELIDRVKFVWDHVSSSMCEKLVKTMPNRILAVLKSHGGSTRY